MVKVIKLAKNSAQEKNKKKKTKSTPNISDYSKVENIEVSWGRKKLKIEIDLDQNFGLTERGKSIRIATTRGRKIYSKDDDSGLGCFLSLTVFRKE